MKNNDSPVAFAEERANKLHHAALESMIAAKIAFSNAEIAYRMVAMMDDKHLKELEKFILDRVYIAGDAATVALDLSSDYSGAIKTLSIARKQNP